MNITYLFTGIMAIFLVVTLIRIVTELRETPVHKGRVAGEAAWMGLLVLLILYNLGFI
jgi:hypothetical protein